LWHTNTRKPTVHASRNRLLLHSEFQSQIGIHRTGFQIKDTEHLHPIARNRKLLADHANVSVTQGLYERVHDRCVWIGTCVAVAGGVGSSFNSARVILPFFEISVLVSDIWFSFQS